MAAASKDDVKESTSTDSTIKKTKKKGVLSRLWGAIFRLHGDNFEKRLQYISKEEAVVLSRMTKRSNDWQRMTRHLISFTVLLEAVAIGYAIMTTRFVNMNWKMRALRVSPMFLLPILTSMIHFGLRSLTMIFERKDQKTLEKLRAERQAKIDELKEKTNYYTTQQLIQRYDPDPAAKAAAATVLASKLGADSGFKIYLGDESKSNAPTRKSSDVEVASTGGLRNRNQSVSRTSKSQNASTYTEDEMPNIHGGFEGAAKSQQHQMVVEHHRQSDLTTQDGGWIARLAALLVGEDPTQAYALICGNCHMHNGLVRKEDFPYVIYYCPRCHALNRPMQSENVSSLNSPTISLSTVDEFVPNAADGSVGETVFAGNSLVVTRMEKSER